MKRRAWLVWLAAGATIVLTTRLGAWQLDRAARKVALHAALQQRADAPPLPASALPESAAQAQAREHRRVALSGHWLAGHTVYLDNRPMAGRVGFLVMTPLELVDGRQLMVQRGWWPRDAAQRTHIAAPPPPAGEVPVLGRIALSAPRLFELAPEAGGPIRQNLDLEAYARQTRLRLLPWVLVQLDDPARPVGDGLLRQWPEPTADVHKHYGYAAQWFALAALVAGLLLWLRVLRPWRARRRQQAQ